MLRRTGQPGSNRSHANAGSKATAAAPHRNPTDGTAYSDTLVMRVKGTENSR
jgi:hypothetical protein